MKRLNWAQLNESARRDALARPPQSRAETLRDGVARIVRDVRERGDDALFELTARHDGCSLDALVVQPAEFLAAEAALGDDLKGAIREARSEERRVGKEC